MRPKVYIDYTVHYSVFIDQPQNELIMKMAAETPDYSAHRERIKNRYKTKGLNAFHDYEVLELVLTYAVLRKDVKPLAKKLLAHFGSFHAVLEAPLESLQSIPGIGEHTALLLKLVRDCSDYYLNKKIDRREILSSPEDLYKYCRSTMSHLHDEHFRVLYLNVKNEIIYNEIIQTGTVDQTAVYPRKIIDHALKNNASALIFVHNHPSGCPKPSMHDKEITRKLTQAADYFSIRIHDHIIVGNRGYYSFREEGLL